MEIHKLKNIQLLLEKSISQTLTHIKNYPQLQEIADYSATLDEERKEEKDAMQEKIRCMSELLRKKSELLKENKIGEITDFKQFKREMILIQENIQNLRSEAKMKLELLRKEILEISDDVEYYTGLVPNWSEVSRYNAHAYVPKKTHSSNGIKCKETRDFIEFVHKSNGYENGWSKEDHQLFLRFRAKYKDIDTIARELHEALPDITIGEIKNHEEWYRKYLHLERKKRNAIDEWRKTRNINKHGSNKPTEGDNQPKVVSILETPEETKEKLLKWKLQKQQEQEELIREKKLIQQDKRKELESLQKKRNEELRKLVEDWKNMKTNFEQQELKQKNEFEKREKRRKALEANRMIKQFQSQDDLYISKMMKQRKQEDTSKPTRSKSSQLAKRDPRRLLKPTKQWINRVHDENLYTVESFGLLPLKNIPKLGLPEWRKMVDKS